MFSSSPFSYTARRQKVSTFVTGHPHAAHASATSVFLYEASRRRSSKVRSAFYRTRLHNLGWILQAQTNSRAIGLATNWFDVPGSASLNSTNLPINPADPTVFYRLRHP